MTESSATTCDVAAKPVEGEATFTWKLKAEDFQGMIRLTWETDAPFRAHQGQVRIYKHDRFPSNPHDETQAWQWDDVTQPWDTELHWGAGWRIAYIAQTRAHGPYAYIIKLVT